MMYEEEIKNVILDTLENRVSSISLLIGKLLEEGYLPNTKKKNLLSWIVVLIHAYNNINSFNREQQENIDIIYNSIIRL